MRERGFTLIELLVTLAVAAILAAVAVPGYQQVRINYQLDADFSSLLSGFNYARVEAVKRRADVELRVTAGGSGWSYEVREYDSGGDPLLQRDSSGNQITLSADEGFAVVFNSLGRVASEGNCVGGCSIELSVAEKCRVIRVGALGHIRSAKCEEEP